MAEKTSERKKLEERIPEDVREHFKAARQDMNESIKGFLPPEFIEHRRKARKEMLLAWRSMIDAALEHMDKKE